MARKQDKIKMCLWTHVQNEAPIIERMLETAVDYIDFWVIVDNGSTDGTQDIIKNFFIKEGIPGELYQSEIGWKGHGVNRQHAWDFLCSTNHGCDYILRMDADEGLIVDESFDWGTIGDSDSYNVIYVSGDYCTPRTWLWNFNYEFYWQDDKAHETIHRKDGLPLTQTQLPFEFRQTGLSVGNSYQDPIKYLKDVLNLETQLHERLRDGSRTHDEYYHLYYLCRSFNYTNFHLSDPSAQQYFPYGEDGLRMFLERGLFYYEKLIQTFGDYWVHYYYRSMLYDQIGDNDKKVLDLKSANYYSPHRAEPVWHLYNYYKSIEDRERALFWASQLLKLKLDLEKDPYDVEVSRYPDKNPELKQELEILLNLKHNKTVIDYSLQIPNRSVINI